jgi:nitroreductase
METLDAIDSRRDVREFDDRPIPGEVLDRILEAGRRSPSSQNWQPWTFAVVTGREHLEELSKVWKGAGHVAGSAATIGLVARRPKNDAEAQRLHYDLGQATVTMMLAAADLGVGSGHSVVEDQDLARRILGFGEEEWCPYLVVLGYPRSPLRPIERPDRRPTEDVVHRVD